MSLHIRVSYKTDTSFVPYLNKSVSCGFPDSRVADNYKDTRDNTENSVKKTNPSNQLYHTGLD